LLAHYKVGEISNALRIKPNKTIELFIQTFIG